MTKTMFSVPCVLTFVPASINHFCRMCPQAVHCMHLPCITLFCSGNVLCVYGLSSRWKVQLQLYYSAISHHMLEFLYLFRKVYLVAFCSCFYCRFKNKIRGVQQNVVQVLINIFFLLESIFCHTIPHSSTLN